MTAPGNDPDYREDEFVELASIVRRVIFSRVRNPDMAEDLAQETLARVVEARHRLDPEALVPYAVVTARNLVASLRRAELRQRDHAHRLFDAGEPLRPEEELLRQEEREAVTAALDNLSDRERAALVAHEVEQVDTATLSRHLGSTPGGVAAQLARARAKLRVDYVLALRGEEPPTTKCRQVLVAISAGDRRRQLALDAGRHLLDCRFCAGCSEPLIHRRRALAALLPIPWLAKGWAVIQRQLNTPAGQATAVSLGVVAVAAALFVAYSGDERTPSTPSGKGVLIVPGQRVTPRSLASSDRFLGKSVRSSNVTVLAVPADEGFWIGTSAANRVWVQLPQGKESRAHIVAGDHVRLRGRVVPHTDSFPKRVGVTASEGPGELRRSHQHIRAEQVTVTSR